MTAELEGAAQAALERANQSVPVSALDLARGLGLEVEAWSGAGAQLDMARRLIEVSAKARPARRHGLIAHEVGHYLLRASPDLEDSEPSARYLAGALLLPRSDFDRDLRRTAWSLLPLRERHPNASAEMIARRIVQLRDAVATIIDNGRVYARVPSPWVSRRGFPKLTQWERGLADAALESGAEVRGAELCYAVPIVDGDWRRVIVVCELEQISLRL